MNVLIAEFLQGRPYRFRSWRHLILVASIVGLGLLALSFPDPSISAVLFAGASMVSVVPVILVGALVAAAASASGAATLVSRAFEGRQVRMIVVASLVGALLPICGITVLPLVAGLLAARVPLAPIMAFWLSSPITSPSMLLITAGTLGWPFAVAKTLAAVGAGLLAGTVTLLLARWSWVQHPARSSGGMARLQDTVSSCQSSGGFAWKFWRVTGRRKIFSATLIDTGRLMILWLTIAFVAEYFLRQFVPADVLRDTVGRDGAWAVPIAALVGAPLYLDGYAALPLVRGLIETSMRADAALALLVAGGITSAWAVIPVYGLVRRSVFALYLGLAFLSAITAGWAFGAFL